MIAREWAGRVDPTNPTYLPPREEGMEGSPDYFVGDGWVDYIERVSGKWTSR